MNLLATADRSNPTTVREELEDHGSMQGGNARDELLRLGRAQAQSTGRRVAGQLIKEPPRPLATGVHLFEFHTPDRIIPI